MFYLLFLLSVVKVSAAVSLSGCVNTPLELFFVGRFGFVPDGGQLSYQLQWPTYLTDHPKYGLALLTASQHIATRLDSLSCQQKLSKSQMIIPDNYSLDVDGDKQFTRCQGQQTFNDESFVYITDCQSTSEGLKEVTYNITMRNKGSTLRREFSADEMYMLETDIVVLFIYITLFTMGTFLLVKVYRTRLTVIYRWFYVSLCSQTCAALLSTTALACFSQTGRGLIHVQRLGYAFSCISMSALTSLLIVLGKGHSITRRNLSSVADTARIYAYAIVSSVCCLVSQISPFSSDDIYDFPDQYKVILVIHGVGFLWLLTSVHHTLRPRPKMASFYIPFLVFYSLWFLAEPIFLLVAFYRMPLLDTPNIRNGVYWLLSLLGHAFFLILIRPPGLENRFPYCLPANKVHIETGTKDNETGEETACSNQTGTPH